MANLPTGTITFLFSDIERSSQLWELYPHAMPRALAHHDSILRQAITAQNGVVFKMVGDGCHAVFHRTMDAVVAALDAQRALVAAAWDVFGLAPAEFLRVRMAIHTGVAELRDGAYFGPTLNRVARLMDVSHGGQILLSRVAADLVYDLLPPDVQLRDLGEHQLKHLSHPEQILQLVAPDLANNFPPLRILATQSPGQTVPPPMLLATKLYIPPARLSLIARPRLIARLHAGLRRKLTLLSAPPGFGKTTLLSAWHASAEGRDVPVAWVSLDQGDNDPTRFWTYVIAALNTLDAGIGNSAVALLQSPQPPPIETILTELINVLAHLPRDVVLTLDDYHMIATPAIHQALAFLLDHLPHQVHLCITSRIDPILPLARLRVRGEVVELRAADLRFTTDEAAAFLREVMELDLSAEAVATLEVRTEGWIAGLQLAALSLQGLDNTTDFINAFAGSHRHIADYLTEEVLQRQPMHLKAFLLQTAILDRLCGSLCDAVLGLATYHQQSAAKAHDKDSVTLGRSSAGDSYSRLILDELERAHLFLVPLDHKRHWYRYHHLFADVLRAHLQQTWTDQVAALHARAAEWYEVHGMIGEAVQHAQEANDLTQLVRLVKTHAEPMLARGEVQTLQGWLDAIPQEVVRGQPQLCLVQAWLLQIRRQVNHIEAYLDAAEHGLQSRDDPEAAALRGELLALRAYVASEHGHLDQAVALARQGLAQLPESHLAARSKSALILGYALYLVGETGPAVAALTESVMLCLAVGDALSALLAAAEVVKLQVLQGQLRQGLITLERAFQWATSRQWQQLPPTGALHVRLGDIHHEQNQLQAAEGEFTTAIRLAQYGPAVVAARAHAFMAGTKQAQGDRDAANAALTNMDQICRTWADSQELVWFNAYRAYVWLMQGDLVAAGRWASQISSWNAHETLSYVREFELVTLTRVRLAQGVARHDQVALIEVLALLAWLRECAVAAGRTRIVIETSVLGALAANASGQREQALAELEHALRLAEPEGYVRIFIDVGTPIADLLARSAVRMALNDPTRAYIERLLAVFPQTIDDQRGTMRDEQAVPRSSLIVQPLAEPLTERETEVLRLLAAGMSSPEIAQHFVVSINTVKTQIKSVYGKLDAHSRDEAIAKAHALQLLH